MEGIRNAIDIYKKSRLEPDGKYTGKQNHVINIRVSAKFRVSAKCVLIPIDDLEEVEMKEQHCC